MNYLTFLSYEQIIYLKKKKAIFESLPQHFNATESIFIHIPKAAGMSVVHSLYGLDVSNHDTWKEYYLRDKQKFSKFFKFTFVREPVDRFLSAYNYLKNDGKADIDKYWNDKYLSKYEDINDFILNGGLKASLFKVEHFIPQNAYIYNKGNLMVDFVGKFENLKEDFSFIYSAVKSPKKQLLVVKNVNEVKLESNLSEDALSRLYEYYHEDYILLGYNKKRMSK